jgi:hypothetical protein
MAFPAKTSEPRGLVRGFHCVRCSDVLSSISRRTEFVKLNVAVNLLHASSQIIDGKGINLLGYRNRLRFARVQASFILRNSPR